ncbi:MAG TPA: hypothetical protein VHP58_04395 [Alphaproteobacteria bacterium]|nr:hypothetical protein [Alphaproteobacteria bacterium]
MSHRTMQSQHALSDDTPPAAAPQQPSNNWRLGLDVRLQQQAASPKNNAQQ